MSSCFTMGENEPSGLAVNVSVESLSSRLTSPAIGVVTVSVLLQRFSVLWWQKMRMGVDPVRHIRYHLKQAGCFPLSSRTDGPQYCNSTDFEQ